MRKITTLLMVIATAGCTTLQPHDANRAPPETVSSTVNRAVSDAIVVTAPRPARSAWWTRTAPAPGLARPDSVLTGLIETGIENSAELSCAAQAVRALRVSQHDHARHIANRFARLVGEHPQAEAPFVLSARAYRWLDARGTLALNIATAYVDVRRLQQRGALRTALAAQYQDNGEIARFRREAGLVPALDGSLADTQGSVNRSELGLNQGRLDRAMARLATLTGLSSDALAARLAPPSTSEDKSANDGPSTGAVTNAAPLARTVAPDLAANRPDLIATRAAGIASLMRAPSGPKTHRAAGHDIEQLRDMATDRFAAISQPAAPAPGAQAPAALVAYRRALDGARGQVQADLAQLAKAQLDEAGLDTARARAERAVDDARLAYRNGMAQFSTLYVTEAAALSVREAQIDAVAARRDAAMRLLTDRGETWDENDLDVFDHAPAVGTTAACPAQNGG